MAFLTLSGLMAVIRAAPAWAGQLNLAPRTTQSAAAETLTSILDTRTDASLVTATDTLLTTLTQTTLETLIIDSLPADVSIEIRQSGLNLTSPFSNSLKAAGIENPVNVSGTAGFTQIQAQSGIANVSVVTNSLLDGPQLSQLADEMTIQLSLEEPGVLTLVPGFAIQNSTEATTAHVAGLGLAAAEAMAMRGPGPSSGTQTDTLFLGTGGVTRSDVREPIVSGGVISLAVAIDIVHEAINEYSPHHNVMEVSGLVGNRVGVQGTTGITQVQAQAGTANISGAHHVRMGRTSAPLENLLSTGRGRSVE